jgi:hypothetical protein
MERDESLLTFVPKHQPPETLDQRKPAKHAEFRVIAQDEWQSVISYAAAPMMDVMNTNIGGGGTPQLPRPDFSESSPCDDLDFGAYISPFRLEPRHTCGSLDSKRFFDRQRS